MPTLIGALAGTALLLITSDDTFEAIVAGSCLLLLFQPRLTPRLAHAGNEHSPFLTAGLIFSGAYAAYFGSAVGILLAGLAYAFLAPVEWRFAIVLMVSSLIGGRLGANLAPRVSGDVHGSGSR